MKQLLEKLPFYHQLVLPYHFLQALMAGVWYGFPGRKLRVIGVTGTNGKTTTAFMIWKMLNMAGRRTGLMTTVGWGVDQIKPEVNHMTTVDAITLNRRMNEIKKMGANFLVLEVTSHALAQFRVLGIPVEIAVLTNLTQDHLDYHKTIKRYLATKIKLFKKADFGVINADDKYASEFKKVSQKYTTYGIKNGEKRAVKVKLGVFSVEYMCDDINIKIKMPGEFNVYNSLAAVVVGEKLGLSKKQISEGIEKLEEVEGRMNLIKEEQNFTVIVDYAHTPDAIQRVLESLPRRKEKIIVVHGGAGRRDPSTRLKRGEILGRGADVVIITEDDSRDENPEEIAKGFIKGAKKVGKILGKDLLVELNREQAIKQALRMAEKNDVVLVLGKGHEKTILRADGAYEFEDIKIVKKLLKEL